MLARNTFNHHLDLNRYLKGCPSCRQQWLPSRPAYEVVTSFLQSLVLSSEPRYAMFGPGMEHLDVSLVTRLMHAPDVLPVSGTPHRQINGKREREKTTTQIIFIIQIELGDKLFNLLFSLL